MSRVILEAAGAGIARIVIDNQARRNALTLAMWDELSDAVRTACADGSTRVIILRGAGTQSFSSGADISEFAARRSDPESVKAANDKVVAAMRAVRESGVPIVAQIHGSCVGGGVALALMCDIRVMEDTGRFGIPAGKLGIAYMPEWVKRLTEIVGPGAASSILLTARIFDARQALAWNFATELAPAETLESHVAALAERMAALAPLSLRASRASIAASVAGAGQAALDHAHALTAACDESSDYRRGYEAFMAGKTPVFEGR